MEDSSNEVEFNQKLDEIIRSITKSSLLSEEDKTSIFRAAIQMIENCKQQEVGS